MQPWTRQSSKCVFCQFRQSIVHSRSRYKSLPQSYRYHECASSSARTDYRFEQRGKLREREYKQKDKRGERDIRFSRSRSQDGFDRGKDSKDHQGFRVRRTGYNPHHSHERGSEQKEASIKKNIEDALIAVQARLSAREVVRDDQQPKPSIMQRLDLDGTKWPIFRQRILAQSKSKADKQSDIDRGLWRRLSAARTSSKADAEQEVYFEFLDFALQSITGASFTSSLPIDMRYPTEWYSGARSQQREIHLHVGPTNSGKTYNALKRLQESKNGFYAGPLRLLAHEVYSRFRANGIPCDLITGDDVRLDDNIETKVYASTVEMVKVGTPLEVAVIDEIQMMSNEERGWAWTRAFLGANAKEVHLCGETRVVPMIRELSASMGDALHIHHYERLNPLRATTKSLRGNLKLLRKGDCIVAFSIMQIHALKQQIEIETGRRCAIVYGSLPPETRAEQADLFNDPANDYDYLVASDAIGMGLNLSIKRIIFNSISKYDGTKQVQLSIPQIKQIAGRAGRYRSAHDDKTKKSLSSPSGEDKSEENVGLVSCLDEEDLPIIQSALRTEAPSLRRAGIVPPAEFLEEYSQRLPVPVPFEYLLRKVSAHVTLHPRFFQCDMRDKLALARITDDVKGLSIEQRVNITAAPSPGRNPILAKCLTSLARIVADRRNVDVSDVPEIPLEVLAQPPTADRSYLEALESLHQCLVLFLWLSYRFITNLRDKDMAMHAKAITEQKINWTLRAFSANPKLRERLRQIRREQKDLVEGHFNTDMSVEGEDENRINEAQPDQPSEAYETQDMVERGGQRQGKDSDSHDPMPRIEDFGAGEDGLDLGQQSLPHSEPSRAQDIFFEGESKLDIARPLQSEDIDPVQPSTDSPESQSSELDTNEALITPSEEEVLEEQLQKDEVLLSDPADAKPSDYAKQQAEGEIPTAKGPHGEYVDPNALKEEVEEGEKLRESAGA